MPYKGWASGDTTFNLATGEVHLVSTGNVSHFGLVGFEQHGLLVPTGVGTFSSSFSWTMTAANGDRMFGTATGTATFTDAIHSTAVATYNVDRRDRAVRGRHAHLRRDGSKHPRRR